MANDFGLDSGLLGGYRAAKKDIQQEKMFEVDMAEAQQNLYVKSLEIQDFLDSSEHRKTKRRVETKTLEAEERLLPGKEELASEEQQTALAATKAAREKQRMTTQTAKTEEAARPLFGLNPDNYGQRYSEIPEATRTELGLTGNWAEDGVKIQMARRTAVDSAAHMRSMELQGLKNDTSASAKAKGISMARKDQEAVHTMLTGDAIYDDLTEDSQMSYRSHITAMALSLQQKQVDAVRNGHADHIVPFSVLVDQVKQIADKHVSDEGWRSWIPGMDSRDWDKAAFNAEIQTVFGAAIPKAATQMLEEGNAPAQAAAEDIPKIPQTSIRKAASVISQARKEQNIPGDISDERVFHALMKAGVITAGGAMKGGE